MDFYNRLKKLCRERGTTPSAVAKEIGLGNSSAVYWKRGSIPRATTLKKLSDYFGVSVFDLLGTKSITVDVSDDSLQYDVPTEEEIKSKRRLLSRIIEEIDKLPERYRKNAINELGAMAEFTLSKYDGMVQNDFFDSEEET